MSDPRGRAEVDLRDHLATAMHDRTCSDRTCSPATYASPIYTYADTALAVFAEWLRERGDELPLVMVTPRMLCARLAEDLHPNGGHRG